MKIERLEEEKRKNTGKFKKKNGKVKMGYLSHLVGFDMGYTYLFLVDQKKWKN